jgi:arylsulfatase A-like enzyme
MMKINRRNFMVGLGAGLALSAQAAGKKPNIIFIMADDHTTQATGAYGSRLAKLNPTPNLDALAKDGMLFDRVFCTNSICTPSRACILTGQYSQTNGVLDLEGSLPAEKQYLPMEMKRAGYQTAMIGKWHLKKEPAAFDYYCVLPGQGKYFDPTFRIRGPKPWMENTIQETGHSTDCITKLTLDWLANQRDKTKPFFLMHHYKAPHDMFENAPRYDSYLEDVEIPEPRNLHGQPGEFFGSAGTRGKNDELVGTIGSSVSKRANIWGLPQKLGVEVIVPEPEFTAETYQRYLKRYLRCVKGVDDNLKSLFDYLKKEGLWENTVILYTGDQGFMLGEHDFIDKRWMYDESMRMPFIVHYPKMIKPGSRNGWLINNTDFAPTMLELAGGQAPEYMQGRSFASALAGAPKPADWRTATYYRYWMHLAHNLGVPAHFGIRTERYKLIFFYGKDYVNRPGNNPSKQITRRQTPAAWELYDLEKDPFEMHNRYSDPEYKTVVAELKAELKKQQAELNEEDGNYPELRQIINDNWN